MRTVATIAWLVAAAVAQQPDPTITPPSSVEVTQSPPPAADPAPATIPPRFSAPMVLEPQVRDITQLHNSMAVPLVGIGIVTGLSGTGASERGTRQALLNMIRSEHLNLSITDVVAGNTALVSLTAMLPPFAKVGRVIDVKVAVTGDATSLRGGQLLRAELRALDQTYVVVQGPVTVGGFSAQGQNAQVQKNSAGTGWVNGGQVVRDLPSQFWSESGHLELRLLNPSFFNATSVASGVRMALADMGLRVEAVDAALVRIHVPTEQRTNENALAILNLAGQAKVRVENPSKVVINQATGTVLAGEGVLISPCVVQVNDLTIAVINEDEVSQPNALAPGKTERVGRTRIQVQNSGSELKPLGGGGTVADLLQNLKSLGVSPAQLVAVFLELHGNGFLHAELEVR